MRRAAILNYKSSIEALTMLLSLGGKITKSPNHLCLMLNGIRYYSLEVSVNGNRYLIQAFEQEACELLDAVMNMIGEKKTVVLKIEKFFQMTHIEFFGPINIILSFSITR
jgi:hypothetical protein